MAAIIAASQKLRKPRTDYSLDVPDTELVRILRILSDDPLNLKTETMEIGALSGGAEPCFYIQFSCESNVDPIAELKNSGMDVRVH
jgi:hypothetical protein